MTSRRRVDYVRVLQALLDALPQPPAVQQTVVSDFEAALWSAITDVFPGGAQRGCEFHFSQAVWRNVQSPTCINRVCRKTQALCFLPADVIGDEFSKLEHVAAAGGDTRVQEHLQYVRLKWVDGCWRPTAWSVFRQPVCTNNVEGWHHRLNAEASHGRLNLYQLLQLLHDEARLMTLAVRLLSECGTSQMQRKSYAQLHSHIFKLWDEYSDGSRSASSLLSAFSWMCCR